MNTSISKISTLLFEEFKQINSEADIERLENIILKALNFDQRIYGGQLPYEVKIKLKNKPKKFRDIFPRQIFEIYLKEINQYAYGVVLQGDLKLNKYDDIIIGFLNYFTNESLNISNIHELIEKKYFSYIANSGIASILDYSWKFVGSYSEQIMDNNELNKIEYATKFMDKFYKSVGNSTLPIVDCQKISEEEYKKIPNPHGIVGDIAIENDLVTIARTGSIHR
ncbi:hypothetical protein ACFVR1_17810 [Psychrobacillus sp. NPDC058041]|uniref:hypothetical protein n=1 Tax=Psychrobacillus sp. NPDC058041 TaxID=3346310 RepID=UPI0036DD807B